LDSRQRHYGKSAIADEVNVFQRRILLDGCKAYRAVQRLDRNKINGSPITFFRRWIGITFLFHTGKTDNLFLVAAVVEQDEIPFLHRSEKISRLVIAHTSPRRLSFLEKGCPGVCLRFLLHKPILSRHMN
jgi:hypothetical protein